MAAKGFAQASLNGINCANTYAYMTTPGNPSIPTTYFVCDDEFSKNTTDAIYLATSDMCCSPDGFDLPFTVNFVNGPSSSPTKCDHLVAALNSTFNLILDGQLNANVRYFSCSDSFITTNEVVVGFWMKKANVIADILNGMEGSSAAQATFASELRSDGSCYDAVTFTDVTNEATIPKITLTAGPIGGSPAPDALNRGVAVPGLACSASAVTPVAVSMIGMTGINDECAASNTLVKESFGKVDQRMKRSLMSSCTTLQGIAGAMFVLQVAEEAVPSLVESLKNDVNWRSSLTTFLVSSFSPFTCGTAGFLVNFLGAAQYSNVVIGCDQGSFQGVPDSTTKIIDPNLCC
eukprot:gene2194-33750_t